MPARAISQRPSDNNSVLTARYKSPVRQQRGLGENKSPTHFISPNLSRLTLTSLAALIHHV